MPGKPPDPGQLRHRITFQRPTTAEEDQRPSGEVPENWQVVVENRCAQVIPVGGSESFQSQMTVANASGFIWCRWLEGPDTTWQIVFQGRELGIVLAIPFEGRKVWLYLEYVERPK